MYKMSFRQDLIYHEIKRASILFFIFLVYLYGKKQDNSLFSIINLKFDKQKNYWDISLLFVGALSILILAVLDGEVAVPCNLQSALARLNSFSEAVRIVWSAFCT